MAEECSTAPSVVTRGPFLVGIALLVFGVLTESIVIFPNLPFQFGLRGRYLFLAAIALMFLGLSKRLSVASRGWSLSAMALLFLYCLSDLTFRPHSFGSQQAIPLVPWAIAGVVAYLAGRHALGIFALGSFLVTVAAGVLGYARVVLYPLIFTDDHPSFLYRLIQLKNEFPRIPFYNPLWNAGVEAREFFPSGALNVFFLFSPLVYAFDPTEIYSALVLTLLFGVTPVSSYLAARLVGSSATSACLSAGLAMTSSLFWYRWALSYGTLGFILSSALVPLVLALWSRLVERGKVGAGDGIAFALSATLSFLWSPALLFFGPILVLGTILAFRGFLRDRGAWVLLAVLLVANGSWIVTFLHASRVGDFVSSTAPAGAGVASEEALIPETNGRDVEEVEGASGRLTSLREHVQTFNPLIFCFGVFGVLTIRHRTARHVFSGAVISAGALAVIGPQVKPQLELERMFVVLAQLLAVPTAIMFVRTVESERRWVASTLLGSLVILPIWMFRVMKNGTADRFTSAAPIVANLTSAIREYSGAGRTIFAGFTLHELSDGHIAPLPAWTGKPIVASRYQHDRWEYTDVIPKYYRDRKQVGVYEYFDLMNVTAVVTHDRFWRTWFSDRPEDFELMWAEERFRVFRRKNVRPSYFVDGEGEVLAQDGSSVRVALRSEQATLKFHYLPFLRADGCQLEPAKFEGDVTLIRIRDCQSSPIEIRAKSIVERILGK